MSPRPGLPSARRIVRAVLALVVVGAPVWLFPACLTAPLRPEPAALSTPTPPRSAVALTVTPLQLGHMNAPRCAPAEKATCFGNLRMVMSAYLVRHPKGTFLVDAGVADDGKADVARFSLLSRMAVDYAPDRTLRQALDGAGAPKVDFVVLTHAHWDHAGGLLDLPGVRTLVGPGEKEFVATFPGQKEPAVEPRHFANAAVETVRFDGPAFEGFPASHDVFGDGSVVLVPLPGHTPGSLGVFLDSVNGKRLLFVGDTAWSRDAIRLPSHKLKPLSDLVDVNRDQVSDALWRLHRLAEREPQLVMVPAHDGEAMDEVRAITGTR